MVDLTWIDALKFSAKSDQVSITLDSSGLAGPSPVQALGFALAGCMTVDVTHILARGRHPFRALSSRLTADRSGDEPHRFVSVVVHFTIEGDVPSDAVERAIALSREKYCSVWHSMRQDIEFKTSFNVQA
jgi:putative redox protein